MPQVKRVQQRKQTVDVRVEMPPESYGGQQKRKKKKDGGSKDYHKPLNVRQTSECDSDSVYKGNHTSEPYLLFLRLYI